MVKAVFLDFYGTVVHEDGEVIKGIVQEIFASGTAKDKSEIGSYWWDTFQIALDSAFGDKFEIQRKLEYQSLKRTIQYFNASADAEKLSDLLFAHWVKPPIFEDTKSFFETCSVPIYIVSNIDRRDILEALKFHGLYPTKVFTSEDARSYKPRKELFNYALKSTRLSAGEIVHIEDSLKSDIEGASSAGIKAIWINREKRAVPKGVHSVEDLIEVYNTDFFNRYEKSKSYKKVSVKGGSHQ